MITLQVIFIPAIDMWTNENEPNYVVMGENCKRLLAFMVLL